MLRSEPLPVALAATLEHAAAAFARLDAALAAHPLAPAWAYRARLDAVRRQAAVDGKAIDPWHLAAVIEGVRLRLDPARRRSSAARSSPPRGMPATFTGGIRRRTRCGERPSMRLRRIWQRSPPIIRRCWAPPSRFMPGSIAAATGNPMRAALAAIGCAAG